MNAQKATKKPARNRWLDILSYDSEAAHRREPIRLQLFCFPYAGGGTSFYRSWMHNFPPSVQIYPVKLPGRENRMEEKPFHRLEPLVGTLARVLRPYLNLPFAFFGYSVGALIAFELAREIRWQYRLTPAYLFAAAFPAPQLPRPKFSIHKLPQSEFIDGLRRFNAMPEEVLQNPELLELFLPTLRADCALYENFVYEPELPMGCPLSVFGGLDDPTIDRGALVAWRELTQASFRLRMFPGKHFFIPGNREQIVEAVIEDLEPILNSQVGDS